MYRNPEGNHGWEVVRDSRFPLLKQNHPVFEVEGSFTQDNLHISLIFEPEVKELWS